MKVLILIYRYKGNRYLIAQRPLDESDTQEEITYFHTKGNFSCDCNRSQNIAGFDLPDSIRDLFPLGSRPKKISITSYPDFPKLPCGEEITLEMAELKEMTKEKLFNLIEFFRLNAEQPNEDGYYEMAVHRMEEE